MDAKDLILVSVDDHLVEPPALFEGRMAARYVEAAPKIHRTSDEAGKGKSDLTTNRVDLQGAS